MKEKQEENSIPKPMFKLEDIYDIKDKFKQVTNSKLQSSTLRFELINLGTEEKPQNINLGLGLSLEERTTFIRLLRKNKYVFAWKYDDLKTYDASIIQHTIPMLSEQKPVQQKLRKIHPNLESQIKAKLNKLLKAKIIFLVRHSNWVSNIVPVRKKNGDIRICIDFRSLNKASQKDNFPFPTMEKILHSVAGSELMSFLDGFSGDTHEYVRKCRSCQISSGRQRKPAFPLQPVNIEQPFEQWGLDIIGEITPQSSKKHKYILTSNDYFTKWVEAIPLKTTNSKVIIEFIDQFIITRFGVPNALVFDNASYFSGNSMFEFAIKRGFKLKYSTNYYPQGNGLAKSTNKNLVKIIKRTIEQNHKNWHKSLIFALWADIITQKASIGTSPFNLVYGKEAVLPTNLLLPSLALVQFTEESPSSSIQLRHDQILKLEEEREKARIIHAKHQQIINSSFDSTSSSSKQLQVGDLVLKWDKAHEDKGKHTMFQKMWLGPFQINKKIGHSTFILQDLSGKRDSLPVNDLILKKFFN
eukprot:PITA_04159